LDAITCFYYFFSFVSYTNDVDTNISNNTQKGNRAFLNKLFIPALVLLVGIGAYGIGKLQKIQETRVPIVITQASTTPAIQKEGDVQGTTTAKSTDSVTTAPNQRRVYVASKTGSAYYLPSCAAANRIAEKNKVWFATKEEAEKAGYKPAQNCKGL
jgi:hypothetical protein